MQLPPANNCIATSSLSTALFRFPSVGQRLQDGQLSLSTSRDGTAGVVVCECVFVLVASCLIFDILTIMLMLFCAQLLYTNLLNLQIDTIH